MGDGAEETTMKDAVQVRIESAAIASDAVQLYEISGRETIGRLFEIELHVVCTGPSGLDEEAVLLNAAEIIFEHAGNVVRRMYGMISTLTSSLHTETHRESYRLVFVPRAFRLSLGETSAIFMDQSVPDIIASKLESAGLARGDDFELRLTSSFTAREYVVQYKESDLHFIARLAEQLGISFFFEHDSGRDVLVFTDHNEGFKPIDGAPPVAFHARGEHMGVFAIEGTRRTLPSRYAVKDYNYRTPKVPLLASTGVSAAGAGEVVEYGAHFKTPEEGEHIAKVRAEELRAMERVFDGKSDVAALGAGRRFKLENHPKIDGELLVVEVRHHASQVVLGLERGTERPYENELRAIPASTPFRPARTTPKPKVPGAITGIVEAAQEGKYAETDDDGRYHVRFLFDTGSAAHGSASRPVRMAQPHAGPGYGFHFPLRDGVEVMLTCIEGDPDRPIITGAVPNPVTPSPVGAKNGMRNVLRTGGGTEINIDDKEGSERIKITTPFGGSMLQLGAPNAPVAGAFLKTGLDARIEAGNDITIDAGAKIGMTAPAISAIAGETVGVSAGTSIGASAPLINVIADATLTASAPLINVTAAGNLNESAPWIDVSGGSKVRVGAPTVEINGAVITLNADGMNIIQGGAAVNISSGAAVTVSAPTVNVSGGTVNVTGKGTVQVKGGTIKLNG
jgi:type VI secretion system VgrG family protein